MTSDRDDVRIRRAPKIAPFLIVGAGVGAMVTFVLTASRPVDPNVGFWQLFLYLSLLGVPAGIVLGAITALVLDRVALRRARTVSAERDVPAADQSGDGPSPRR